MTLLKGALVSFTPTFLKPAPNVTLFQYNPESLTHTWNQPDRAASAAATPGVKSGNPFAVPGMPEEEFALTIVLDSNQDIADQVPISSQLAAASGIYTRLAALEMLLYPVAGGATSQLLGQTAAALTTTGKLQAPNTAPPRSMVPVVLFVWGAFRIVPVRVTGLTITEKLYDEILNPVYAEVALKLRVLTPAELAAASGDQPVLARLGTVAYTYTLGARQAGALANLGNAPAALAGIV